MRIILQRNALHWRYVTLQLHSCRACRAYIKVEIIEDSFKEKREKLQNYLQIFLDEYICLIKFFYDKNANLPIFNWQIFITRANWNWNLLYKSNLPSVFTYVVSIHMFLS